MKVGVVIFGAYAEDSVVATNRIAKYIKDTVIARGHDCKFLDNKYKEFSPDEKFDTLFIINGPTPFSKIRDGLQEMFRKYLHETNFIWVGNDYSSDMMCHAMYRFIHQGNYRLWAAYENFRNEPQYDYINWNQLTFVPGLDNAPREKIEGIFYYGAWRKSRVNYFETYFKTDLYPVYISPTTPAVGKKFQELGENIKLTGRLSGISDKMVQQIGEYSTLLYMEDRSSHNRFCSPANRFYEYISSGSLVLFDSHCKKTFDQAGVDIEPYIVNSPADVKEKMLNNALRI
jgi:hypothetical protein